MSQFPLQKIIILAFYKFDKQERLGWFTKQFCKYFDVEVSSQTLLYEISRFRSIDPANNVAQASVDKNYLDIWKYYISGERLSDLRQIYNLFKKNEPINGKDGYSAETALNVVDHPVHKPSIIEVVETKVQRDEVVLERALELAGFVCELDCPNDLFERKKDGRKYTEGHHLIPLSYQDEFDYSLDVEANIVSLCPACHRLLHYGKDYESRLCELLSKRRERLEKCNLFISEERLIEMYK